MVNFKKEKCTFCIIYQDPLAALLHPENKKNNKLLHNDNFAITINFKTCFIIHL